MLTGLLVYKFTDLMIYALTGVLVYKFLGLLVYRPSGTQVFYQLSARKPMEERCAMRKGTDRKETGAKDPDRHETCCWWCTGLPGHAIKCLSDRPSGTHVFIGSATQERRYTKM